MQQATYTVTQANNCTLLQELLVAQACKTAADMVRHSDGVLDEMNGVYEDDMARCGLHEDANGDVVFTEHMTYERAMQCSGRAYVHALQEMMEDREDAAYEQMQAYCMLAIVQRNIFIADAQ